MPSQAFCGEMAVAARVTPTPTRKVIFTSHQRLSAHHRYTGKVFTLSMKVVTSVRGVFHGLLSASDLYPEDKALSNALCTDSKVTRCSMLPTVPPESKGGCTATFQTSFGLASFYIAFSSSALVERASLLGFTPLWCCHQDIQR